ncbi:ubiquitin-conjugating enzyme E2 variant 3 isoform X3 [Nannospalax galili]|uniref:ubiquitin-conjugating enzyme E2 variant 3 isoform X3 n=1 Tax=Nannospalax galili TaxID=1026970 RepID=UPI0004ED0D3F|nr:ubiquitin-conjugating enzyme E2 variant 3 isoform X3 [Nannospalax galili]
MEFDCEGVRRLLGKYKFRDLTIEELKNVNTFFPHFRYSVDTYVFKDSSQKDLLNFTGTIPVMYQGNTYNIPIRFWILDSHPFAPPICFLKPTANMEISVGKHVDAKGRIYLPYLQNWSHPKSAIVGLIKEMIAKFQEELPLYSTASSGEARQADLLAYIAKITKGVSDINSKGWANHETKTPNKITVVGSGELGIACTLAIAAKGIADKLVLLDLSEGTKQGTMDLDIFNVPNVEISKVEIMAYVTWKLSTFPANGVIGIGCNLDSQRLQYIIRDVLKAQTSREVWVVGEQGEDRVSMWSDHDEATSYGAWAQLSNRAMELLRVKGQRSWSVGLSVADLVETVVNNKKKVHSVSVLAQGYYGIDNEVFLSLPCVLGASGISKVITSTTKDTVTEKLQSSASSIHSLQQRLKL